MRWVVDRGHVKAGKLLLGRNANVNLKMLHFHWEKDMIYEMRLQVLRMGVNNIEAKIISGGKMGEVRSITRMIISPSDKKMLFQLDMRQFPISVCFAMTINKSQGQTLSKLGLYLKRSVFFPRTTLCNRLKSKKQERSKHFVL